MSLPRHCKIPRKRACWPWRKWCRDAATSAILWTLCARVCTWAISNVAAPWTAPCMVAQEWRVEWSAVYSMPTSPTVHADWGGPWRAERKHACGRILSLMYVCAAYAELLRKSAAGMCCCNYWWVTNFSDYFLLVFEFSSCRCFTIFKSL